MTALHPAQLIEHLPIPMIVTSPRDQDNPIIAVNAAFERLSGYGTEEALGRNCRFLACRAPFQEGSRQLAEAVREGRDASVEIINFRKDGSAFLNNVMIAPWHAPDGSVAYFVGTQMEVAGRKPDMRQVEALQALSFNPRRAHVARLARPHHDRLQLHAP